MMEELFPEMLGYSGAHSPFLESVQPDLHVQAVAHQSTAVRHNHMLVNHQKGDTKSVPVHSSSPGAVSDELRSPLPWHFFGKDTYCPK